LLVPALDLTRHADGSDDFAQVIADQHAPTFSEELAAGSVNQEADELRTLLVAGLHQAR
jgi:hypothetical protein